MNAIEKIMEDSTMKNEKQETKVKRKKGTGVPFNSLSGVH